MPESEEELDIDQVYCSECGRPMVVLVSDPRTVFVCARCKSGKTPEWEY